MDGARFDRLARSLTAAGSRRGLLAAALAALLGRLGLGGVAAACRGAGKACAKDGQCCSRRCTKRGRCACIRTGSGGCGTNADCCSGVCAAGHRDGICCGNGQVLTDEGRCGCNAFAGEVRCRYACCDELLGESCCDGTCCKRNEECAGGRCKARCGAGFEFCRGTGAKADSTNCCNTKIGHRCCSGNKVGPLCYPPDTMKCCSTGDIVLLGGECPAG